MASSASTGDVFYLNKGTIFDRLFTSTISSISSNNLIDTAANYNFFDQDPEPQFNETFISSSSIFNSATTTEITNSSCLPLIDRQLQNTLVIFSVICMVIINLVIIFGNLLVILSVFLYTKLRSVTNFFIVSLAVADLLIGLTVVPYSLTQNISKAWYFGKVWCIGWLVTDVWLSTSSILNLVAISIDRYIAITRPLKYRTMMTPKRAKYLIACAWILSFFICFPPLVLHGQEGSYGLLKTNLTLPNSIDSQKKSHPSSFSSSILPLNQNPFNSFSQQTTPANSELNKLSTNIPILDKFFHNSDISQRNKKERHLAESEIVTSAPLIVDPNLVWLEENKFKQEKFNKRRYKRESNLIFNPSNSNLDNRLKNKNKFNLQNKSKYKNSKLHKELNKQSVNYKHFKRWKRESINNNRSECNYEVLQCILFDSKGYVIYSAVGSFFIPMFIMIFFYWRIYLVAMYTTKALNRGYISNKSVRANPMAILTGSKSEIAASNLQKTIAGSTQFNNLDNSNSDMVSSNLTLRVHRGYFKDQSAPTQLNLANDLNRKSTNRSSYDSTGRSSTSTTTRANSTVDTTAAQLCRRLLPTRLSNRILSNNDAKQLRKIQHRSVRCLDRTQNVVTLAVDASRPRTMALKRTQSEQCIELNQSDDNLNKNLDKTNKALENKNQSDTNDDKEKDENADKDKKINDDKNENENKIEIINNKLSDLIENKKFESKIRVSNSEKNIKSKLQLIKQYSLSSNNLLNVKDQQKIVFDLKKNENILKQNASQIKLNIVPPQDVLQGSKLNSHIKCDENDQLIPKDQQNGYHEINNNLNKADLIENLDTSNQLGNNLSNLQNTYHLATSGSVKSKYLSYWSRFSKKRSNLNKNANQNTNSSGKFQAKRFIAETKAAKTVGIIVGCFWLCWFPFFVVYLTRGLCEDKNCIPEILLTIFTWLGYLNSALNPIIYGMFSKDFRRAFKNIICKCRFSEETGISTLIRQIHLPNLFEDENMI